MKIDAPSQRDPRYTRLRIQMLLHQIQMKALAERMEYPASSLSSHFSGAFSFDKDIYDRARQTVQEIIKGKKEPQ